MSQSLMLLLLLAAQPAPGPSERMLERDRTQGPTPVTGMFLIPPKIPDCRTKEEVDAAAQAKAAGEFEKCDPERFIRAHGH
jgi:hypothetical protein